MKGKLLKNYFKVLVYALLFGTPGLLLPHQTLGYGYDYHNEVNYPPQYFEKDDFIVTHTQYELADIKKQRS